MLGIVQFVKSVIMLAIALALAGTLAEMTGVMGREAAKAYRHGGEGKSPRPQSSDDDG